MQEIPQDVFRRNVATTVEQTILVDSIKTTAEAFYKQLHALPKSRNAAVSLMKLEECVMWAVKAATAPAEAK